MTSLDELERLLAAATPGPWRVSADEPYEGYVQRRNIEADASEWITCGATSEYQCLENEHDAALIVAAVNALPDVIAAAKREARLREALDRLTRPFVNEINGIPTGRWVIPKGNGPYMQEAVTKALAALAETPTAEVGE